MTLVFLQGAEQPCLPWGYLMPGGEEVKGSIHGLLAAALSTLFFHIKHTEYSNATEGDLAQFGPGPEQGTGVPGMLRTQALDLGNSQCRKINTKMK